MNLAIFLGMPAGATCAADTCCPVNYWAILVAAIAYFCAGAIWYSPVLFSKTWMAETKIVPDKSKSFAGLMITTFLITVFEVIVLSLIIGYSNCSDLCGGSSLLSGLSMGVLVGLGFVATTLGVTFLYEGRSLKLFLIDAGYHIIGLAIAGAILGVWK